LRDRTASAFSESLGGDIETAIESRAKILPGDGRRQLDQTLFSQFLFQGFDQAVGRVGGRPAERFGVVENRSLELAEGSAGPVISDFQ